MKICFEAILSSLQFDFYPFLIVGQIRNLSKNKKRNSHRAIYSRSTFGYDFIPIHLHSIIVEESSMKTWQVFERHLFDPGFQNLKIVSRLGSSLKSQGLLGPDISRRWQLHG